MTLRVALAGNPNCGKTALFNALTGSRQKVANYPGVTVERKEGSVKTASGLTISVLDLPGTYSLDAHTPDEAIARDVILGKLSTEAPPRILVVVADVTNLERNLGLLLELKSLGKPVVLVLNMMDLAIRRGIDVDVQALSKELGVTVIPTVAVKRTGIPELLQHLEKEFHAPAEEVIVREWKKSSPDDVRARFAEVDRILKKCTRKVGQPEIWTDKIDHVVLHPVYGTTLLLGVLALMFQAIFTWAKIPQEWIQEGLGWLGAAVGTHMPDGALKSLLADGIISGVGAVLVFLPQILLLFLFILFLEDSGYMSRAAFLMDRLMGKVGLNGRAFIPLLSSYACAIPGIMATRTIENKRDRMTTILVAPLTTCSARLPVYSLLIAAFIPNTSVLGFLKLQGLVMLGLYLGGIIAALVMAVIFKKTLFKGAKPQLLMELPTYKWPSLRGITLGLLERSKLFVRRAGTVILSLSVILWFLASYPHAPEGATEPAIRYSYAGKIGGAIEPFLKPLGFDWRISVALIPGFAAREVMVGALATVYAVEAKESETAAALGPILAKNWSLATALSLLVWYILACQCLSTLAVTRRETNSWRWPIFMVTYMTALAYVASFVTYRLALWAGWG